MIGAAYCQIASSGTIVSDFTAEITPNFLNAIAANGNYRTPLYSVTVTNGVGPFTYEWASSDGSFSPSTPSSETTYFNVSGFNQIKQTTITCKVIDTGNGNDERNPIASLIVQFQ